MRWSSLLCIVLLSACSAKRAPSTDPAAPNAAAVAESVAVDTSTEADGTEPEAEDAESEEDTPVPLAELPEVVRAAVVAHWPEAELLEAEWEGEHYEIDVRLADGTLWEAEVSPGGELLEVEEEAETDEEEATDGEPTPTE